MPGDTTGTWLTNNSNGIRFGVDLGSGSNYQGTVNAWQSGWRQRSAGTVNFCQNTGATFQLTGVQLEAGSVASPFERRDYGRELIMCQRYYEVVELTRLTGVTFKDNGDTRSNIVPYKVNKRATPTVGPTGISVNVIAVSNTGAGVNLGGSYEAYESNTYGVSMSNLGNANNIGNLAGGGGVFTWGDNGTRVVAANAEL